MESKRKSVTIIGGDDGPISIFVAGSKERKSFIRSVKYFVYKIRRMRLEERIQAQPHTIKQVIRFIMKKYNAKEIEHDDFYLEHKKYLKQSLIEEYRPELLKELPKPEYPKEADKDQWREFHAKYEEWAEGVNEISEKDFPMDFHIYKIKCAENASVQINIEKVNKHLAIQCTGENKYMRPLQKIATSIYRYYGVTEKDIEQKTERYEAMVCCLCEL